MGSGEIGQPAIYNFESVGELATIHECGGPLIGIAFHSFLERGQTLGISGVAVVAERGGEVAGVTGGVTQSGMVDGSGFGVAGLAVSGALTGGVAGFFFSSGGRIGLGAGSVTV